MKENIFKDRVIELKKMKASEITSNPKNWRSHPKRQNSALNSILKEIGIAGSLLAYYSERDGGKLTLIDGHLRQNISPDSVWPVLITDLKDAEADILLALFDPINKMATVNKEKVQALVQSLDLGKFNLIQAVMSVINKFDFNAAEGATEINYKKKYDIKNGQLWRLGKHEILCGDCTIKANIEKILRKDRIVLMVTDPPYGVQYDPKWRKGLHGKGSDKISGDKLKNDNVIDWTDAMEMSRAEVIYIWHSGKYAHIVGASIERAGYEIITQIIWTKQHFAISRGDYHWGHEPCYYAKKKGLKTEPGDDYEVHHEPLYYAVKKGRGHNWNGARDQTTVWEIKVNRGFMDSGYEKEDHSTQKPIECMAIPIKNNSTEDDIVYDPFGGSGTTLIACEMLKRACRMIELDPKNVDMTLQRWEKLTGEKPELVNK